MLKQPPANLTDHLRIILESVGVVPWAADARTLDFIYVGPQADELLGYTASHWLVPGFRTEVLHPEDRGRVLAALRQLDQSEIVLEYRLCRADGSVVWCHDRVRPVTDQTQALLVGALVDVSERRRNDTETAAIMTRNAQLQTMAEVGRVATRIAHDFNNLLTLVMGNVELVLAVAEIGQRLTAEDLAALRRAQEASVRAGEFTRQLSELDPGRHGKASRLEVAKVLRSVEPLLVEALGDPTRLVLELDAQLGQLDLEPGQLEHLLLTLIASCGQDLPQGEKLKLRVSRGLVASQPETAVGEFSPGWHVQFSVTCHWMAAERFRHWHQPFQDQRKRPDDGLWLTGVLASVVKAGGYVDVGLHESGCRFELSLPAADTTTPGAAADYLRHGRRLRVMVCEDPGLERQYVSRTLRAFGHSVVANLGAADLSDGEVPAAEALDLLVIGASQQDLAQQMRRSNEKLKVLLISDGNQEADRSLKTDESVHYIPRPFGNRELAEHISDLLDQAIRD